MEKGQIRVALKWRNSNWSSYSVHWALPHWSEDSRMNQRKGKLKLRKWGTKKERREERIGVPGSNSLCTADASLYLLETLF